MRPIVLLTTLTTIALATCFAASARADRIVLRNLTMLTGTVTQFDEDGVIIEAAEKRTVTWDEIEAGTVAADKQAAFDAMLAKLGEPLFRIKARLDKGSYEGMAASAESAYPVYAGRKSASAYMVCQGLMWGRLQEGKREQAVEPYLRCIEYLRQNGGKADSLPGSRRLVVDLATGLSPELPPVWFDAAAAREALPGVKETIRGMATPRPSGAYLIYATLALAAGEAAEAEPFLSAVDESTPAVVQLRDIALAQREVQAGTAGEAVRRLQRSIDGLLPVNKPLAQFWIGMARLTAADAPGKRDGVLELLRLPALYGKQSPELAAAGLYHALKTLEALEDNAGSIALRKELLSRYAGTVHATRLKSTSSVSTNK
jgi:hypothetical protein